MEEDGSADGESFPARDCGFAVELDDAERVEHRQRHERCGEARREREAVDGPVERVGRRVYESGPPFVELKKKTPARALRGSGPEAGVFFDDMNRTPADALLFGANGG